MIRMVLIVVRRLLKLMLMLTMILKVGPVSLIEVPVRCFGGLLCTTVVTVSACTPLRGFAFVRPVGRHIMIVVAAIGIMPVHMRVVCRRGCRVIVGRVRNGVGLITTIWEKMRMMRWGLWMFGG